MTEEQFAILIEKLDDIRLEIASRNKLIKVPISDRYKLAFEHHRFVSEYRLSLLKMWGAMYVALAAVFVWAKKAPGLPNVLWTIPVAAVILTWFFYIADWRHRPAIGAVKAMGEKLETAAGIERNHGFFLQISKGVKHGVLITIFAVSFSVVLIGAAIYLGLVAD
jgi:hypothetical protein